MTGPGNTPAAPPALRKVLETKLLGWRRRWRFRDFRGFVLALSLITLLGLSLRLYHVSQLEYSPQVDMVTYLAYGELYWKQHIQHKPLTEELLYLSTRNPPAYPLYLAALRSLFGQGNLRPPLYLQAFIDAGTLLLLGIAGRILYGARAGLLAALLYALYRIAITNSSQLMTETLAIFFAAAAYCLFLLMLERPSKTRAILTGLAVAAAIHTRFNTGALIGAFGLITLLEIARLYRRNRARSLVLIKRIAVVAILGLGLLIPWSIRNSIVLREPVLFIASSAAQFIEGANPLTRGEFIAEEKWPASYRERIRAPRNIEGWKKRTAAEASLVDEFLQSHTSYFFLTILPNKLHGLLWTPQFTYAGHGPGAAAELPFGPRIRIPLAESMPIVAVGLIGLLLPGRRYWGSNLVLFLALFAPLLMLCMDPRYRFISEFPLVISTAAVVERLFFRRHFRPRFAALCGGLALFSAIWSLVGWSRFSGPNLAAAPDVFVEQPLTKKLVTSSVKVNMPRGSSQVSLPLAEVPVDPKTISHLLVEFHFQTEPPPSDRQNFAAWSPHWPKFQIRATFYDDTGTTLPVSRDFPQRPQGALLHNGARKWNVVELPGTARRMQLTGYVSGVGTLTLSGLKIQGPVWLK